MSTQPLNERPDTPKPSHGPNDLVKQINLQLFSDKFNEALDTIKYNAEKKKPKHIVDEPSPPATPTTTKKQNQTQPFSFDLSSDLQELFPTMGLTNIQRIDTLFAFTAQSISEATNTPSTPQVFIIALDQSKCMLNIRIQQPGAEQKIQLNCNPALHQLLLPHMAELKQYLKKRAISFDDLSIHLDESLDSQAQIPLKNNIPFSKD